MEISLFIFVLVFGLSFCLQQIQLMVVGLNEWLGRNSNITIFGLDNNKLFASFGFTNLFDFDDIDFTISGKDWSDRFRGGMSEGRDLGGRMRTSVDNNVVLTLRFVGLKDLGNIDLTIFVNDEFKRNSVNVGIVFRGNDRNLFTIDIGGSGDNWDDFRGFK